MIFWSKEWSVKLTTISTEWKHPLGKKWGKYLELFQKCITLRQNGSRSASVSKKPTWQSVESCKSRNEFQRSDSLCEKRDLVNYILTLNY